MFDKGKFWHAKKTLQLLYSDNCGCLKTLYLSHAINFLTFIDDYSRKSEVYFLKYKSETFRTFKNLKSMVENESDEIINTLITYNVEDH